MTSKIVFFFFIIIMSGIGLFLLIYGIKGGLIEKKILANAWRKEFITGRDAIVRGWFYIATGLLFIIVLITAIIDTLKHWMK